ncbi:MAG: DUF502 domain-containing protein [Gemmatimonadales bacterium]|nr:DUF502 domain-containing protein [Gemmatimonadales bacterium]
MKLLVRSFVNGLLLTAPVALTLFVCWRLFITVDGWLGLETPGLGFLATVAIVTAFGFLASNVIGRVLVAGLDTLLERLPGVRLLYGAIKDVFEAFGGEKRSFDNPVLVTVDPVAGIKLAGFLTNRSIEKIAPGHVAVYVPQSYAFAGLTLVVPADRVQPLDVKGSDVLTFAVSGGVSAP